MPLALPNGDLFAPNPASLLDILYDKNVFV